MRAAGAFGAFEAYAPLAQQVFAAMMQRTAVTTELDVAEAVYRAATDVSGPLRYPANADALALFTPASAGGRP